VGLRAAVAAVAAITAASGIVVDACLPYLTEHFGNPSSSHAGSGPELAAAEVVPPPEVSALPVMVGFMVRNDINP
jgi:hypothetical protein